MFIRSQRLPISDGVIVDALRTGLTAKGWGAGLSGGTDLPSPKTVRMFTVRDDSGPLVGRVQSRRQGLNFWAASSVDALNMALDGISVCEAMPDGVVVAATRDFAGPVKIQDEVPYVVSGKTLSHYYVAFIADVKAVAV